MCCCWDDTCGCIRAAIISIMQSLIHLSSCAYGIDTYACNRLPDRKNNTFLLYLTYFYNEECGRATWEDFPESINISLVVKPLELPPKSPAGDKMNNILVSFVTLDTFWIIASIILIAGILYRTKPIFAILKYPPWLLLSAIMLIFDLTAAIQYSADISKTRGFKNWFEFIGGKPDVAIDEMDKSNEPEITTFPSILMFLLFSRFFVLWILNLYYFFRVTLVYLKIIRKFNNEENAEENPTGCMFSWRLF